MRVGIIRCMQTEDYCPGTTDFRMIREKKGAFENIEEDIAENADYITFRGYFTDLFRYPVDWSFL